MAEIDTSVYEPVPQVTADRLVGFVRALILRSKGIKEKSVLKALKQVREHGQAFLDVFYAPPAPTEAPSETKQIDHQVDTVIGAISQRILDWGQLPEKVVDAGEVQRVHAVLFPLGTSILKLPYRKQWAHCDRMFKTMENEGLEKQVAAWVGAPFLAWGRDRMAAYGEALKITSEEVLAELPSDELSLVDAIVALRRAVNTYVRTCISQHEIENLSAAELVHVLSPIAELRAEVAARPKKDDTKKPGDTKPGDTKPVDTKPVVPEPVVTKPVERPEPLPPVDDDE